MGYKNDDSAILTIPVIQSDQLHRSGGPGSTNLADHFATLSHDDVFRFLKEEKLTPRILRGKVNPLLTSRPQGYMIFNDVVLKKNSFI